MPDRPHIPDEILEAIASGETERIEELWLESLDQTPVPTARLLEIRRLLWKEGHKTLARTLLELLVDALEDGGDHRATLAALRELVRLTDKPDSAMLGRLAEVLTRARTASPSLAAVQEKFPLATARRPLDTLEIIERWLDHDRGTVVEVIGQGVGRVVETNLELEHIKVDLGGAKPVSVPFGAIARYVHRLPEGDFRRRSVEDREVLVREVQESPGESLLHLLESLGEPVDVTAIKAALEGLVPQSAWTSWWNRARKHPRLLTSGSGSRLRYSAGASAEAADEALLDDLRSATPRDRLAVARRLATRGDHIAATAAGLLNDWIVDVSAADPGLAWETGGVLAGLPGGSARAAEIRRELIEGVRPLEMLSGVQDRVERDSALDAVRDANPEEWSEIWADWMLHEDHPVVLDRIMAALEDAGSAELADAALEAIFRNHIQHPAQFVWALEAMARDGAGETLRRRMTPSILEKLPDALEKSEFGPFRGRTKALLDGGQVAVKILISSASPKQAERFIGRVGRISTVEPQRLRILEQAAAQGGAAEREEAPLFVATRASVEAKRAELKQLLEVEIPRTLKGINAAAAEGDLRENFEYHMLRDRQELQSARAAKIQRDLGRVRILEPGTADCSRVNIGTVVHLTGVNGDALEPVTILGAWDADVDRRIFANASGVAQGLMGGRVGDAVEVGGTPATIMRIEPWAAE